MSSDSALEDRLLPLPKTPIRGRFKLFPMSVSPPDDSACDDVSVVLRNGRIKVGTVKADWKLF